MLVKKITKREYVGYEEVKVTTTSIVYILGVPVYKSIVEPLFTPPSLRNKKT